jgi:hypothetical protein
MGGMRRYLAILLTPLMMVINLPLNVAATEQPKQPTAEITHKAVEKVTAGQRVQLEAEIEDKNGVEVVRVYFKAEDGANYNFVDMTPESSNSPPIIKAKYSAVLPAPNNSAKSFTYLILVKNSFNVVVKSQNFWVKVEPTGKAPQAGRGPIRVFTELEKTPTEITGFSDNISYGTVETAAKFGVVAGLYQTLSKGADGVVYGGTVASSQGGITTGTIILGSVVAAAVVGGVAALASSGGSSSSSSGNDTSPPEATCPFEGLWQGTYSETDCFQKVADGGWNGSVNASCVFTSTVTLTKQPFISGTINAASGEVKLEGSRTNCSEPVTGTAIFKDSTVSGSYSGGANGSFAGTK